jgi:hypothetical protein
MQKRLEDCSAQDVSPQTIAAAVTRTANQVGIGDWLPLDAYVDEIGGDDSGGDLYVTTQSCGTIYRLIWDKDSQMWMTFQHDSTLLRVTGDQLRDYARNRCRLYAELHKAIQDLLGRVCTDVLSRTVLGEYVEVRDV